MPLTRHQFDAAALYREPRGETLSGFLSRRWSFWLALFSCFAFLVGNMVGQHGWKAFWKSVWGKEDTEIVFTGTVNPLMVMNTVPYIPRDGQCTVDEINEQNRLYTAVRGGNYTFGGEGCGSHVGLDVVVPQGTSTYAIANGIVHSVQRRNWGFGNTVVIRHPNVPSLEDPTVLTTLYSGYSHLSTIFVREGQIVDKGQRIALTGDTGTSTTPHLQFQIDKETAEFHPYWAFTKAEADAAGVSFFEAVNTGIGRDRIDMYTVDEVAYINRYKDWQGGQLVQEDASSSENTEVTQARDRLLSPVEQRKQRRQSRILARNRQQGALAHKAAQTSTFVAKDEPVPTSSSDFDIEPHHGPVQEIAMVVREASKYGTRRRHEIVLYAKDADGNYIHDVAFDGEIYFDTGYGSASFLPNTITAADFGERGRAQVAMYTTGERTVVPIIRGAFTAQGEAVALN